MFVHLDPISGVVEPYSNDIQEQLKMQCIPSDVNLGSKCFNATIHLRENGKHYQTTPGLSGAKQPGYRQVRRVTARLISKLFKTRTEEGWRFCTDTDTHKEAIALNVPNNRVAAWQWCSIAHISPHAQHWLSYESGVNEALEEAWTTDPNENFHLIAQVNNRRTRIIIDHANAFFVQEDIATGKQNWVRRILVEIPEIQQHPNDTCAICICNFSETALLPHRTLPCNHTFHCECLTPMVDKKCPMCRASFS